MITLSDILRPNVLRRVHKNIRKKTRSSHVTQALLVRGATLLAAAEYELDTTMRLLRLRGLDGSYRPQPPQIVEAAKAAGLRRPLTYLEHGDAILIRALCGAAQEGLLSEFPPWVSFGREDTAKGKAKGREDTWSTIASDYDGWFIKWLRYHKLLSVIAGDAREYVVTSDVANFFPTVDLLLLRERFNRANALDPPATDLVFYLIESIRSATPSGTRAAIGLPQDPYDASRILAHFFLRPLDLAFNNEGTEGRYTRWVDDVAVSVKDTLEGQEFISRIQMVLRKLGLHPNTGKTLVMNKDDFRKEHYGAHNEFLDVVHNLTEQHPPTPLLSAIFERRLRKFLNESPRLRYWFRVLRRFYTQSRRVRSGVLAGLAELHLREFPAEATHIFDYLTFHRDSGILPTIFFQHVQREGRLYEDVQILGYESVMSAAFLDDPLLRWSITKNAYDHFRGVAGYTRPTAYVRGLIALVLYKFGGPNAVTLIASEFPNQAEESPVYARQAFPVLYSIEACKDRAAEVIQSLNDPVLNQTLRFLRAIETGEDKAVGIALGLLEPRETKCPARLVVPARALPLLAVCRRATAKLGQVNQIVTAVHQTLTAQPEEHRDGVLLRHLK